MGKFYLLRYSYISYTLEYIFMNLNSLKIYVASQCYNNRYAKDMKKCF